MMPSAIDSANATAPNVQYQSGGNRSRFDEEQDRGSQPLLRPHFTPPESSSRGTNSASDLVFLIHGTFAANADDAGKSWWQIGSIPWDQLRARLPAGARLPQRGEVFHWCGENSERARIKAGHDLLEQLLKLEQSQTGYHLIGHSHGGSVIWHALREATLRRIKLDHLRSWSTVGTPFLHCRTHGALSVANLVNLVLALLLLWPASNVFLGFFRFAWAAVTGRNVALEIRGEQDVGIVMSICRAPLLKIAEWCGIAIRPTETGLRLGTYDPASGQSLFAYMFGTWEGLIISLIVLAGGYIFLVLASQCLNPVLESLRLRMEKRLEQTAMESYRSRWLGLWSTSDEAINGLRATLDLSVSFVARMVRRDQILWSDYLLLISRPYDWIVSPTFNHLLRPLLDRGVRSLVTKTAQGNNRPAAEVVAVSPFPVLTEDVDAHPSLPQAIDTRLVERANEHARDIAPKLRNLLAAPSFVAGMERFGQALEGQELIHTSYFDHAAILDLLAMHVAWGGRNRLAMERLVEDCDGLLWPWFCKFKRSVAATAMLDTPLGVDPQPALIRPRRRGLQTGALRAAA